MQAVSRESYVAALKQLDTHVPNASARDLAAVAGEILDVAALLSREPGLRRALVDANRVPSERVALLSQLLTSKVSKVTLELLGTLVAGHWPRPSALLDAVERLGAETFLASAERDGVLGDVEDELFRLGQVVSGDSRLAWAINDSTADPAHQRLLIRDLLAGKTNAVTSRLAELAVTGFGGRGFENSITRLVELAAERRNRSVAYVTVASALSEDQESRLAAELRRRYRREITTMIIVDPTVMGGMSVRIGHDLYDGTIQRRLSDTRNALGGRRNIRK